MLCLGSIQARRWKGEFMRAFKRILTVASHLLVVLSFMSGFIVGAIFGETVIDKFGQPTPLTYFLAQGDT